MAQLTLKLTPKLTLYKIKVIGLLFAIAVVATSAVGMSYIMQQPAKIPMTVGKDAYDAVEEARKAAEAEARKAAEAEARKAAEAEARKAVEAEARKAVEAEARKAAEAEATETVSKDLTWSDAWDGPSGDTGCKDGKLDSKAWCAQTDILKIKHTRPWIQLDTGMNTSRIHGIVTQGRPGGQWVTRYESKVSNDENNWYDVVDRSWWIGNTDSNTKVINKFPTPVVGRYVRIYPTKWDSWPSMRMGVILSKRRTLDSIGLYGGPGTSLDLMQQTGLTVSPV